MSQRDLWQEVLLRQIMDARLDPDTWPVPARYAEQTAEARAYLTTPSEDLETVCSLAGVDVMALVERMQKRVAAVPPVQIMPKRMGRPARQEKPPAPEKKSRARTITHAGETLTYRQWAERTGLSWFTIRERHKKGWQVDEVLRPNDLRGVHMRPDAA